MQYFGVKNKVKPAFSWIAYWWFINRRSHSYSRGLGLKPKQIPFKQESFYQRKVSTIKASTPWCVFQLNSFFLWLWLIKQFFALPVMLEPLQTFFVRIFCEHSITPSILEITHHGPFLLSFWNKCNSRCW